MSGYRRKAREYALQLLFRLDLTGEPADWSALSTFFEDKEVEEDVFTFTRDLVLGAWGKKEEIDAEIRSALAHWSLERLAAVDRGILRLATHEILHRPDIPASVSINEAIEIAKRYSTADSPGFINGVLDKIAKESGRKTQTPP